MSKDNALAAGQGGTEVAPAPQPSTEPAQAVVPPPRGPRDDEVYRRLAVEELTLHLTRGGALLKRCEEMAELADDGEFGAIFAAARLMNANAQVAKALAQVAMVERRTKTIVEKIQRPDPKIAGLFSSLPRPLENQEIRAVLECGLRLLLEQRQEQQREEKQPEALAIGCGV